MESAVSKIKICGITRACEAEWLNEADVDYAGFVFYEKSKRNISIAKAKEIAKKLKPDIKSVAVLVSPDEERIREIADAGFDILQIHGECDASLIEQTRLPVWQAFQLKDLTDTECLRRMEASRVSGVLLDAGDYGSGKTFGWEHEKEGSPQALMWYMEYVQMQERMRMKNTTLILAGGLNADNVAFGTELFHPDIVDVSSGVEQEGTSFAGKNREKILAFVQAVRQGKHADSPDAARLRI